eukprot:gene5245-3756_t
MLSPSPRNPEKGRVFRGRPPSHQLEASLFPTQKGLFPHDPFLRSEVERRQLEEEMASQLDLMGSSAAMALSQRHGPSCFGKMGNATAIPPSRKIGVGRSFLLRLCLVDNCFCFCFPARRSIKSNHNMGIVLVFIYLFVYNFIYLLFIILLHYLQYELRVLSHYHYYFCYNNNNNNNNSNNKNNYHSCSYYY